MRVTIIVPIYKGNQYINNIVDMVKKNIGRLKRNSENVTLELLLVNDFPDEKIEADCLRESYDFEIKVLDNKVNQGIHQTRVNGLERATGEYVLFLDQDDLIADHCIESQINAIGTADIVIGNGYKMFNEKKKMIYRGIKKQRLAMNEKTYLYAANQIVSPGHCLVKREAIPEEWKKFIMKQNGNDDLFLWLLMFEKGSKFAVNPDLLYTHVDTGENISLDFVKMCSSAENLMQMCEKSGAISKKTITIYKRRIDFLKELNSGSKVRKVLACLKNPDICFYKLYAYYL